MNQAIVARNLTKVFGGHRAVDDLSFEVPWGRITGFLGPNGAGKSTTLRMILGLAAPTSGSSEVSGTAFGDLRSPAEIAGGLLETQQFHPRRNGRNHLRVYAAAAGLEDSRVDEVLDLVDLSGAASKNVGEYSLGMRQRLGLAGALLGDPRILVLDEPANGLDPSGIRWLRKFLRGFAQPERAVFLSSHLLGEIAQIADELIVINAGRLVIHAGVHELVGRAHNKVRVRTDQPEHLRDLVVASGARAELVSHDGLVVEGATAEDVGRLAASSAIPLFGLTSDEADLEDVFLEMTGAHEIR